MRTFKPVILSDLDSTKRQNKGTWIRRFKERLEKISADEAYSDQERDRAMKLSKKVFFSLFFICHDSSAQPKAASLPRMTRKFLVVKTVYISYVVTDIFVSKRPSTSVDAFFDVIEKEKQVLSAKREVDNRTVCFIRK